MPRVNMTDLEVTERLARIEQLHADAALKNREFAQSGLKLVISAATAGAALMGAAVALVAAPIRLR